jgi:hypothetical protein
MVESKKRKLVRPWQDVAKEAQDHRDVSLAKVKPGSPKAFQNIQFSGALPKNSTIIPEKYLHLNDYRITEMFPEDLLEALASGKLSAVDATTAFLRRAVLAQKPVNIIRLRNPVRIGLILCRQIASRSSFLKEL